MYISTKEAAQKWGISERRVRVLCKEGRVDGAIQSSWAYLIPRDAPKPGDGRQLRHLRQAHTALGRTDLGIVDAHRLPNPDALLIDVETNLLPFIAFSFALSDMPLKAEELKAVFALTPPSNIPFVQQLLVTNMRSALLSMVRFRSRGQQLPPLSEIRLKALQAIIGQGLEGVEGWPIRDDETVKTKLEVLLLQDEREFSTLHPLERALFWYAQIVRIAPFEAHNSLLAALVFAQIMIDNLWIPNLGSLDSTDELKAALVMTQRRGNYRHLLEQVVQAYRQGFV